MLGGHEHNNGKSDYQFGLPLARMEPASRFPAFDLAPLLSAALHRADPDADRTQSLSPLPDRPPASPRAGLTPHPDQSRFREYFETPVPTLTRRPSTGHRSDPHLQFVNSVFEFPTDPLPGRARRIHR